MGAGGVGSGTSLLVLYLISSKEASFLCLFYLISKRRLPSFAYFLNLFSISLVGLDVLY